MLWHDSCGAATRHRRSASGHPGPEGRPYVNADADPTFHHSPTRSHHGAFGSRALRTAIPRTSVLCATVSCFPQWLTDSTKTPGDANQTALRFACAMTRPNLFDY